MAKMPRGEPRSTVDSADRKLAEARAKKRAQEDAPRSLIEQVRDKLDDYEIREPGLVESFIPVVGPAWEAAYDLQEGDYAGAALNGAMAVADVLPIGVAAKGARYATKGVTALRTGGRSVSAEAIRKHIAAKGLKKPGTELHHTIPLNGKSRSAQDWRNHPMFLKQLPIEQHRRLTGSWAGKPKYDPIRKIWYGTTDWQKVAPTYVVTSTVDAAEAQRSPPPAAKRR